MIRLGATLYRGFNRAVGSLLAGIFAILVIGISMSSGRFAEPFVVGFSIFLIGMHNLSYDDDSWLQISLTVDFWNLQELRLPS